jgi:D-glycerate 3-kinase
LIGTVDLTSLSSAFDVELTQTQDSRDELFADWCQVSDIVHQLAERYLPACGPIIGISGSQGSGKSTLAMMLSERLQGMPQVSLDDFYLGHKDRQLLSREVHPLLATRGVPGTHNHERLESVLAQAKRGEAFELPSFDKGSDDQGVDRSCKASSQGLILEGWCLGVEPELESELEASVNSLEMDEDENGSWRSWVNEQLKTFYQPIWRQIDFWIHLVPPSFDQVVEWRSDAEAKLPAKQQMTPAQITRFIQHYERLTLKLWRQKPLGPGLLVVLDEHHAIADIAAASFR